MDGDLQQRFPFDEELTLSSYASCLRIGRRARDRWLAGTGKTAAALHRAAYLCSISPQGNGSSVLFLCFNKALAAAVRKLVRLCRDIKSRIEVRNIDRWCRSHFDDEIRKRAIVSSDKARIEIVYRAMREVQRGRGSLLFRRAPYWFLSEIKLIKGCGFMRVEQYLEHHAAAGSRLNQAELRTVFEVAGTYDTMLWNDRRIDFDDFASMVLQQREARQIHAEKVRARDRRRSTGSIGDAACIRRSLARRSVTLIADHQQAIYEFRRHADSLPAIRELRRCAKTNYRSTPRSLSCRAGCYPTPLLNNLYPASHSHSCINTSVSLTKKPHYRGSCSDAVERRTPSYGNRRTG